MHIINLFAGPGTGKTTVSADVFSALKKKHINCELVPEYAKDLTWQESYKVLQNQFYVWGKQHQRIFRLKDKVDVVVTDSPFLLSIVYDTLFRTKLNKPKNTLFHQLIYQEYNEFKNLNFFLKRDSTLPYIEHGRNQKLEEAKELDNHILTMLQETQTKFWMCENVQNAADEIVRIALREINKK